MIFAKVDVTLPQHHRFLRIPAGIRAEAIGVWTVALLWSRGNERDGWCPLEAIDGIAKPKIINELVRVGLMDRRDDEDGVPGVTVLRYEEHNETKAQIDRRRQEDRDRKSKKRPTGFQYESGRIPVGIQTTEGSGHRGSDSDSGSDSGEEDRRHGLARNAAGDGAGGMAVDAWRDAVRSVTGGVVPKPFGQQLAQLVDAIREGAKLTGEDPVEWARRTGKAFASQGGTLNVFRFVEFITSTPAKEGASRRHDGPVETPADAIVGEQATENFTRLRGLLANAGRLPETTA